MTLKRNLSISTILCLSVLPLLLHSQSSQSLRASSGYSGAVADRRALIQQMVNSVSRENIVINIAGLQAFGNRFEYSLQQEAAADWIVDQLKWWNVTAESDWYQFGTVNELKRLKELEEENRRLKQMYANLSLEHEALKDIIEKKL